MSAPIDASILIVSYNTKDLTLACLESVYAQTHETSFEIILVDNQSKDGSADAIEAKFPQVKLIRAEENLGFARANNFAAKSANGKYLLLLNPDTVILDGAIDRVVAFAQQHMDAGIWGGRTFFDDMSLNRTNCHNRPTPWSMFCLATGLSAMLRKWEFFNRENVGTWPRDTVRTVDCITGCFLLITTELWRKLEGFDDGFFMFGEETDLCMRAAKLGAKCLVCPQARLIHYGGRSETIPAERGVKMFRAKMQLFNKHWSPTAARFGYAMLCLWSLSRATILTLVGRRERAAFWGEIFRRRREWVRAGSPILQPAKPASRASVAPISSFEGEG